MDRPEYLQYYLFNWEMLNVVTKGKSALDARSFLGELNSQEEVGKFLEAYGFKASDPILLAELFGNFQEALQFIKRYFLLEGNQDGLDLKVPQSIYAISEINELFLLSSGQHPKFKSKEDKEWASIILKVMHTILHTDKDLRHRYFTTIQMQIFDRFYKFCYRDNENRLYLKGDGQGPMVPLFDFQTKAKKSRDSIIIKLLHKQENVAEELFDRIGVRFVTFSKFDVLRVIHFLFKNYCVMVHNLKPSRAVNTLFNMDALKNGYGGLLKTCIREGWSEENFKREVESLLNAVSPNLADTDNKHTNQEYKAIHFTGRHLVRYKNPFMTQFKDVRKLAKENPLNPLSEKVLNLDTSTISRDLRFFYPFEVQITDLESHQSNTQGEASHEEYKKSQLKSAMLRLFKPLLEGK